MKFKSWALCSIIICGLFFGCSSADKIESDTAEGAFDIGQRFEKDERYEEAIVQYNEVTNKHPYSKLALEAKLRVADIHYKREGYVESQTAYMLFKDFHPRHAKIDYVTFRLAMSYYKQLPETIDCDLSIAKKSILYFDEVIESYSGSEYVAESKEHKAKALRMLAEKELYIADFYFVRDQFDSALGRFEDLLETYPTTGVTPQALYGAAMSAHKLKDNTKASKYYETLVSAHPSTSQAEKIKREIGNDLQ